MSEENLKLVMDFTNELLAGSGLNLKASIQQSDDGGRIQVRGDDVSVLLGHNAELLDALEYLGNRLLTRLSGEESKLIFDSGSYRGQREKELRLMASKAAERVKVSKVPFSFDPMNPNERRIIHLALADDQTIRTESQGNGEHRRVTIHPAK